MPIFQSKSKKLVLLQSKTGWHQEQFHRFSNPLSSLMTAVDCQIYILLLTLTTLLSPCNQRSSQSYLEGCSPNPGFVILSCWHRSYCWRENSEFDDSSKSSVLKLAYSTFNNNKQKKKAEQTICDEKIHFFTTSSSFFMEYHATFGGDSLYLCTCLHILHNYSLCCPVAKWCFQFT